MSGMWANMQSHWCMVLAVVGTTLCLGSAGAAAAGGDVRLWAGASCGRRLLYALDTGVLLNEEERRDQEVGWRLRGTLAVTALAHCEHTHEALLRFELPELSVQARGAGRTAEWVSRPSAWDGAEHRGPAHALWRAGRLDAVYLPAADTPAYANYKRALLSLFQFQILDGERNETDSSGACLVRYETMGPLDFRKIKSGCEWEGGGDAAEAEGEGEALVSARRVTRYTLRADGRALHAVAAEEVLAAGGRGAAGGKARAWARLALAAGGAEGGDGFACAGAAPGLGDALRHLPADALPTALPLEHTPEAEESLDEESPLSALEAVRLAAREGAEAERAGGGGAPHDAAWVLRAHHALRAASAHELGAALQQLSDIAALTAAARALGGAGTAAALDAANNALQLRHEPVQPAARAFLAAFGTAPHVQPAALQGVLSLSSESRCEWVRRAALLAAAGAAGRAGDGGGGGVRDHVARHLARCKDEPCLVLHVTALGNLRRADTVDLLLQQLSPEAGPLEDGARGAGEAALHALALCPPHALHARRLKPLLALAADARRPLTLRALALDLAVTRSAEMPAALAAVARQLHSERGQAAHELRRVLYQRLDALAPAHPRVGDLLRAVRADKLLGSWHARAHAGTSSVLRRETGWRAGGWGAGLDSLQLAKGGVLLRGGVALGATHIHTNRTATLLHVRLWTRGLAKLTGGGARGDGGEEEGEDEAAGAGLALAVGGVALPDVTLFESQTELLGHVWAGRGSEPTPVLRAPVPLGRRVARVPAAGGVWVRARDARAAHVALDAAASVSLWARTAAATLQLRAAATAHTRLHAHAPYARAALDVRAALGARLLLEADLDFYEGVALCVRAHLPAHALHRNASLLARTGARAHTVRRTRTLSLPSAGRTLSLGALNDRACRTLAAGAEG